MCTLEVAKLVLQKNKKISNRENSEQTLPDLIEVLYLSINEQI